jgi:opacity protein-like surface antigen
LAHLLFSFLKHYAMIKQISLLFFGLFVAIVSYGQQNQDAQNIQNNRTGRNNARSIGTVSFGLEIATPINQFRTSFDGIPVGISAQILGRKGFIPLEYGIGFSWLSRGTMDNEVAVYEGTDFEGDDIYSSGNMAVNSNIYTGTGIIRLRPFTGRIQPYAELMAGGRGFSTVTIISVDEVEEDIREKQNNDFAFTYGWGAGMRVNLNETIAVEGRFTKMNGTSVNFVDRESIEVDGDGNLSFERIGSRTDIWSLQFGVSFNLR